MDRSPLVKHISFSLAVLLIGGCGASESVMVPPGRSAVNVPTPPAIITTEPARPVNEPEASKSEFWLGLPPGIIESRSQFPRTEVTEWTFANGARVILHPSQSEPRRVRLVAFAPSNLAGTTESRAVSAVMAARTTGAEMNPGSVRVGTYIAGDLAVVAGDASTESLGELLEHSLEQMRNPMATSAVLTSKDALTLLLSGYPETALAEAFDSVDETNLFGSVFGDPRRFTYVIAGDVIPSEVEAQTASALTSMRPSIDAVLGTERNSQPAPTLDRSVVWTMLQVGEEEHFLLGFRRAVPASYDNLAGLEILGELLADRIRTTSSQHIDVDVDMDFTSDLAELRLSIRGPGSTTESVSSSVFEIIESLRANEPSARELVDARAEAFAAYDQAVQTNTGWLRWLVRVFRYDHDTREILNFGQRIRGVSASRVRELAQTLLTPDGYALVMQRSE